MSTRIEYVTLYNHDGSPITVTVEVDFVEVAKRLGRRASDSKSGKSTALHGAVSAVVKRGSI